MNKCPICSSDNSELLFNNSRGNKYLENYLCLNCGFVFVFPRITRKDAEELYINGQFSAEARSLITPDLKKFVQTETFALNRVHVLEQKFPDFLRRANKCLEIGCGSGSFLWLLKNRNQIVTGIEPDNNYAIAGHQRYNINIKSTLFEEFKTAETYDLICSFHVIEHIIDPSEFIHKVRSFLNENGLLFLECPTIDNIYTSDLNTFFWDVHVNTFSDYTLPFLLKLHGFKVLEVFHRQGFLCVFASKEESIEMIETIILESPTRVKNIINSYKSKEFTTNTQIKKPTTLDFFKYYIKRYSPPFLKIYVKNFIQNFRKKDSAERKDEKNQLPEILKQEGTKNTITFVHVSAFSFGNAGDTLLPVALRDLWNQRKKGIHWVSQPVYPTVDNEIVSRINASRLLVVGGGGLFLKDTNANLVSGWQWPCSAEMLDQIRVPLVLFAVGYNRFRGQEEFEPVFAQNLKAMAEKAVFLGIRNHGSIHALKNYLPESLHHKLVYQPCMTTFLQKLYPDVAPYDQKEPFIALNCAFDRSHLRFGSNIGQILTDIALVCKELSNNLPLKFYSHMQSDQAIIPFLQAHRVPFELVNLQNVHPKNIIEAYAKPKLVLGMRGHAQMIPFGCNTPIVSIVSHNKMQWFLDDIGHPEWGADVLSANFKQELLSAARAVLEQHDEIMNEIRNISSDLYELSVKNADIALKSIQ